MKYLFLLLLIIIAVTAKGQDTEIAYFRIGNTPGYGRTDTFPARLLVQAGPHWDKRKVEGFVILTQTSKGCRTVGFLTKYKKPFPQKFELLNHELITLKK